MDVSGGIPRIHTGDGKKGRARLYYGDIGMPRAYFMVDPVPHWRIGVYLNENYT